MASKRNPQAYRGREHPPWPAWIWLGIGVLLGLALSALVLLKDWAPMLRKKNLPQPNLEATAPKEAEPGLAEETNHKPAAPKKTYDFYSVLPEMEVVIPEAELSAKARAERQRAPIAPATPTPSAETGARYVLLAGSYADPRAAEEAKARLALLGIVAKVQSITIDGKPWHRVLVGPYANASDTEAAQKALADNGIKAIPMKQAANP
jgi:cell division protein FtsN